MPSAARLLLAATPVAGATLLVQWGVAWSDSAAYCRESGVMFACLDRWLLAVTVGLVAWLGGAWLGLRAARVRSPALGVLVLTGVTLLVLPRVGEVVGLPDAGWPLVFGGCAAAYVVLETRVARRLDPPPARDRRSSVD